MEQNRITRFVSFVIPVLNEQPTIEPLYEGIKNIMQSEKCYEYEIILIDDGSKDDSWLAMQKLAYQDRDHVRVIRFRKNFGKSHALVVGFECATGDIIITMDADLQDEPQEIPKFLRKIEGGLDLVSGWKANRQDPLTKTLPSKVFNFVTRLIFGVKLHDFNCGFKALRKEVIRSIKIYGELHRYIPILVASRGFRIGEISIHHNPRRYGKSKYGFERYVRGFLDLLTIIATTTYQGRPGHLFGGIGVLMGMIGSSVIFYLTILWFENRGPIGTRPLLAFGIMMVIMSVQFISLGLLAELVVRHSNEMNFFRYEIVESIGINSSQGKTTMVS